MGALGAQETDDLSERALRAVLGLLGLTGSGLRRLLDPPDATAGAVPERPSSSLRLLSGATVALSLAARRAGSTAGTLVAFAARPVTRLEPFLSARRLLEGWAEQGAAEQEYNRELATRLLRATVREVAAGVLDQIDLDGAADRIDVDRIARRVDVGRVAERIDLDRVAARLDVNAVVARADLEAVIARLDLADLVRRVLDEIDFAGIVRESSGTMAVETVDAFRDRGVGADRFVSRIADRVMFRSTARDTTGPPRRPEEP
ncbi:hypothetical protein ACIRF8_11665 [Streptomyces sp. NPDC102406]|uniref:hypothetical protein n=1 Tax=Streptomyces sp. NPDC102406 TaxID=3366171 RepID=UPI0038255D3B